MDVPRDFGEEKAAALFRGKPLLIWAVERLQEACAVVAVNAPAGSAADAAAMARTVDGHQPLFAVRPVSSREAVSFALAGGEHPPLWQALGNVGVTCVDFEQRAAFANLNTRADPQQADAQITSDRNRR